MCICVIDEAFSQVFWVSFKLIEYSCLIKNIATKAITSQCYGTGHYSGNSDYNFITTFISL